MQARHSKYKDYTKWFLTFRTASLTSPGLVRSFGSFSNVTSSRHLSISYSIGCQGPTRRTCFTSVALPRSTIWLHVNFRSPFHQSNYCIPTICLSSRNVYHKLITYTSESDGVDLDIGINRLHKAHCKILSDTAQAESRQPIACS